MKKLSALLVAPFLTAFLLGVSTQDVDAQANFGAQGSWGSETDFGVGGRILLNIPNVNLEAAGTVDIYFPDHGDFWEVNGNVFYHFHLPDSPSVLPYLGAGLNVATASNGASNTEFGLNIGGGVRFPTRNLAPFVEGRAVISDFDQFVVTGGIVFGPAFFR